MPEETVESPVGVDNAASLLPDSDSDSAPESTVTEKVAEESQEARPDAASQDAATTEGAESKTEAGEVDPRFLEVQKEYEAKVKKAETAFRAKEAELHKLRREVAPFVPIIQQAQQAERQRVNALMMDNNKMLEALEKDAAGTMAMIARNVVAEQTAQQMFQQEQVESQQAYSDLMEYAEKSKVAASKVGEIMGQYGNFQGMPPKQALELAKALIDREREPQMDAARQATADKIADEKANLKLKTKTPAGTSASMGKPKSADDKYWDDISSVGKNMARALE